MKDTEFTDWISIYKSQPENDEIVMSRISGEEGYTSNCTWDSKTRTFRTFKNGRNKFEITIWKHDEWRRAG